MIKQKSPAGATVWEGPFLWVANRKIMGHETGRRAGGRGEGGGNWDFRKVKSCANLPNLSLLGEAL